MKSGARIVFLGWMLGGFFAWTISGAFLFAGAAFVVMKWTQAAWVEPVLRALLWAGISAGIAFTARRAARAPGCERVRPLVVTAMAVSGAIAGAYLGNMTQMWLDAQPGPARYVEFVEDADGVVMLMGFGLGALAGTFVLSRKGRTS